MSPSQILFMIGHWYLNILLAWRFCEMRTLLWGCVLECTDSQIVLKIYFVTVHNYFIAYQKILILSYLTHLYELCSAILNEKNHCNQTFTTISVPAILNGGGLKGTNYRALKQKRKNAKSSIQWNPDPFDIFRCVDSDRFDSELVLRLKRIVRKRNLIRNVDALISR